MHQAEFSALSNLSLLANESAIPAPLPANMQLPCRDHHSSHMVGGAGGGPAWNWREHK
jgi:hypothetical protein